MIKHPTPYTSGLNDKMSRTISAITLTYTIFVALPGNLRGNPWVVLLSPPAADFFGPTTQVIQVEKSLENSWATKKTILVG